MSFVTADLAEVPGNTSRSALEDSTLGGLSSEALCSCDICSFQKLKEVESTLPPGLPMPYISSWASSQFSQTSLQAGAPLAPRTGYEQPYWHRPCYFGWHYVTRASQVTHHAAFHQPENISSAAFHFSRYHATDHNDTGCLGTGDNAPANHARHDTNTYHDTVTENRLGRMLGGVAYDHGYFPKIVSIHYSKAERYQESSTSEATADCHCNTQADTKNVFEDVTDGEKSTNHSISTILGLPSSSPVQKFGSIKPLSEVCSLGNNARISPYCDENEVGTESDYISTEDEITKMSESAPESATPAEGLANTDLQEFARRPAVTGTDALMSPHQEATKSLSNSPNIPPLKIAKTALISHRMRKINKIQKRLKHEQSERKKARFLKKIDMLLKEIGLLTNGSQCVKSTRQDESPLIAAPVKTSPLTPNVEMTERAKMVDPRIQDWKAEFRVDTTIREYSSPEKSNGDLCGNGLRMNVFEKLGLLNEEDSSCGVSTSSDSSPDLDHDESDPKTAGVVTEPVEGVSEKVFEGKGELDALRSKSEPFSGCEDNQEFNENMDILAKSVDSNNEGKLECETLANTCNRSGSENQRKVSDIKEVPKRKQGDDVFSCLSAKRRCKTLPRKVVWKYVPLPSNTEQEKMEGIAEKEQNISAKAEVTCGAQDSDPEPLPAELNVTGDVNGSHLSINVDTDSSSSSDHEKCLVYDDDILQRKLELRESKISDLLLKQEGLLQTIEKMATKNLPRD